MLAPRQPVACEETMSTTSRIPTWLPVLVLVAAGLVGYRWLSSEGPSDERATRRDDGPTRQPVRMVFRDGKWVRVNPAVLRDVLRDLAARTPGLVRISGTVRDSESGQRVAGAEVVFANELGENSAVAGEDGTYSLEVHPGFYRAFARADGYVAVGTKPFERLPENLPDASRIGMPRGELAPLMGAFRDLTGVDMHLRGGARIVGTVFDTDGRPVAGAVVSGRLAGYQGLSTRLILGTDMDESDLDGSFRLEVPAGPIEVTAAHEDFAGVDGGSSSQVLQAGQELRMDLTLIAGCIIEGQVVDARGELVADGSLELWNEFLSPPNDFAPIGRIEAGRFRLARTFEGDVRLRAWPWKSPPTVAKDFHCQPGTRYSSITFVVPDGEPDLEGLVVAADGTPMAQAYIDIQPLDATGMAQQEQADAYGEWAFYSLPEGQYRVLAHVPRHGVAARTVSVPSRGIKLVLGSTGAIAGTTQGMDEGAFTFIIGSCEATTMDDDGVVVFDEFAMPQQTRIVPVENGTFHIDDLPACALHAVAKTPTRTEHIRFDIKAGSVERMTLDLRAAELKTVYGIVTDKNGAPASSVAVSRIQGPGAPAHHYAYAQTDADGRYEIQLYTGDQMFLNGPQGWGQAEVSWAEGDRERIDITLSD